MTTDVRGFSVGTTKLEPTPKVSKGSDISYITAQREQTCNNNLWITTTRNLRVQGGQNLDYARTQAWCRLREGCLSIPGPHPRGVQRTRGATNHRLLRLWHGARPLPQQRQPLPLQRQGAGRMLGGVRFDWHDLKQVL